MYIQMHLVFFTIQVDIDDHKLGSLQLMGVTVIYILPYVQGLLDGRTFSAHSTCSEPPFAWSCDQGVDADDSADDR